MSSENTAAPQSPKAEAKGALDRYFKITERGSTIAAEFRGGLATFFAMSYIVVLNPLIIGLGKDASGNALGVPQVAAMTALVAGVMTILMGVIAKQPFAMAAGLGVRLSGPRVYDGHVADEPWVNAGTPDPTAGDLQRGLALYLRAMFVLAAALLVLALV